MYVQRAYSSCLKTPFHNYYSRTSIIRPSIIRNLDYPAWQERKMLSTNGRVSSCYHGHRNVYLLRIIMRRRPHHCCLSISGWIKAWFIHSIIALEQRCPDNRGSTVTPAAHKPPGIIDQLSSPLVFNQSILVPCSDMAAMACTKCTGMNDYDQNETATLNKIHHSACRTVALYRLNS